jgi:UDP-N-acetylmuramate: L-alanyl-gamma-D-glutamyl-meso-diaminopimelate ligase
MHQLAIALKKKGYTVTGSDDEIFEPARSNLSRAGILPPEDGWFPGKIVVGLDAIILGMHARADNPELVRANELKIKVFSFPEYIFHESRDKKRVVVGGSHGKTTTTSMIMHVLQDAGFPFDYLVGAALEGFEQSVRLTGAPTIICEGDEYPASATEKKPKFHFLRPDIAVLTGIAWDHINVFPTFESYLEQFRIFLTRISPGGLLIYNGSDEILRKLVEADRSAIRKEPYGLPAHRVEAGQTLVTIEGHQAALLVFGDHNLLNLQAAWLVTKCLGIGAGQFVQSIARFRGASKRLEKIGENGNTSVYRDFAHAPSKVKASIMAVKTQFPGRKLTAVLELHTYSSLNKDFIREYATSLDLADSAAVFYSGHALLIKKMPPLDPAAVKDGFAKPGLEVFQDADSLHAWMTEQSYQKTNLLLMSSGNYDGLDILTFVKEIMARKYD